MAKYFHRLPNGDFLLFESYDEYLRALKSRDSMPVITMLIVGALFIAGAIWKWDPSDLVGNFALLGSGIWTVFFTVWAFLAGCNRNKIFGIILFIIGMIPLFIVLDAIGGFNIFPRGISWIRSLFS